jgi:EAL domain-containing protein (putative c-di-GMP-specific phosphodiesterase class I)
VSFELTESMAARDLPAMIGALARLRMRGFGLAIDDFGTGYASLAQLSAIPFSALKIDRSFVTGALTQAHMRAILESSIQLGQRLGLETTAEGIETVAEADLACRLGCDAGQGFLYSPALDAAALERWVRDQPKRPVM